MSDLTADDRIELIKLNFTLLAENMAALAKIDPDKSIMKLNAVIDGMFVGAAIMAKEELRQ